MPLLTGSQAERAREAIADIAAALRDPSVFDADPGVATSSVGRGSAGAAMFFGELARTSGDQADEETAFSFLDRSLELAVEEAPTAPLYSGTTGVGFVLSYLQDHDDETNDVDDLAVQSLGSAAWPSPDLIRGVTGVGVYFLERLPAPVARKGLDLVVERLTAMAETSAQGTTWYVDPMTVLEDRRELFPEGYYDVGMAHGQAGMVALLACAYAAGVESAKALLEGSTAWLLAQRLPDDSWGRYPLMVDKRAEAPRGGRLAWCYGDAGVASALLAAGRALHDEKIENEAVDLARLCATRTGESASVGDAPLCHGSAGLMHVFNRLAQQTGDERLADAARGWFDDMLARREDGRPVAGFGSVRPRDANLANAPEYEPLAGFLEGASGIGLALLAATNDREYGWDSLMLTSPPQSGA